MSNPHQESADRILITKPKDFDSFWNDTLEQLTSYEKAFEKTFIEKHSDISHHAVNFNSLLNTKISAYFLHWNDTAARPLVIYTHGYNDHCNIQWQWAERGFNVFGFDTRGFGNSAIPIHKDGWIVTGIESAQSSILRGAVCDYLRAAEIARLITPTPSSRTLFYGYSFGGAMALIAEALGQSADMVVAGVPSFGWMEGRRKLVKLGSGREINRYIHTHPQQEARIMQTLSYFDTANFATLIKKPTLIGIGQKDMTVPPQTVRAISDRLKGPHIIREFPYSHSNRPEEQLWQNFEQEWQQMVLTGHLGSD